MTDLNKNFIGLRSYPLQFELIDLEFELFKNFNKFKFRSVNNNITKSEYISIKNFIKFKPFKVVQVDKNLGTAIVSNNDYDNLCLDHLNNNEFFEKVNQNPLIDTVSIINNELTDLKINKQISKSIFNKCFVPKPRLGKFRILMKLHKPPKLSTRPIVNCINHPTSKIAYIIDYILQPYVKNTESYLKDSQHLLNDFKDLIINQVYDMYTLDFENLYMNLILNHMSTVISEYMSDKFETNDLKIGGFNGLLKLVLFHNYISFSNKFYLQIKGIAMGCKCAPVLANLYLYLLEKKFLFIHKPFFYKRYLDDLFLIIHKDFNIELLYGFFENLKLTISCKNGVVNFLDLDISFDYTLGKIKTSLFIKPTQSFSFLLTSSNHPDFIFKNIPKSILIRVRRNCTNLSDYFYFSNIYIYHFLKKGYDFINLCKISDMIARLDRNELIKYKNKTSLINNTLSIPTFLTFDKNFNNHQQIISDSFSSIKNKYTNLFPYNLNFHLNMQPSISSILIHNINSFIFTSKKHAYIKCSNHNCYCKYSSTSNFIKIKKGIHFPISTSSDCLSTHFIYIIHCKLCDTFYIGQSQRKIKDRIGEHVRSIINFTPFSNSSTTVSNHFNLVGHDLNDFEFFIPFINLEDEIYRRHLEAKLICLFKNTFNINIINNDFPSPYIYSYFVQHYI